MSRPRFIDRYSVDPDRLGLIVSFVAVAEHLSFIEAANELNLMSSTISRQISRLEGSLGARLFSRTTRRVSLTEAGELYLRECRRLLQNVAEMDALVSSLNSETRGTLRVSAPVAFGRLHVSPAISAFLDLNPMVKIEVNLTDRYVDVVGEGYDLVIRTGILTDSTLIAKRVGTNNRILVAAPSYVARNGRPVVPEDLSSHNCLRFSHYNSAGSAWQFARGRDSEIVRVDGNFVSNNSDAVVEAALEGVGIALAAFYLVDVHVAAGRLVQLLPAWSSDPVPGIYLVYPSRRLLPPKVKAFAAFLEDRFKALP